MSIKLVSFKLCPFVQRAVILLEEKAVAYTLEYKELDDPPANQAIDINTLSRRVFAHGKASKRRCSTPKASFDNAVGEQTHDGLSLTYH
jgi:hypothetical protein